MPFLSEAEQWAAERKRVAAGRSYRAGDLGDALVLAAIVLVLVVSVAGVFR